MHNSGSSGYGSLGSNGSHEHLMSVASSSDSTGNNNEDTHKDKPVGLVFLIKVCGIKQTSKRFLFFFLLLA